MTLTSPPVRAEERTEPPGATTAPGRRRKLPLSPKFFIVAGVAAAIGYLALVPLGYLLWGTFFDAEGFDLGGFERAYSGGPDGRAAGRTRWPSPSARRSCR